MHFPRGDYDANKLTKGSRLLFLPISCDGSTNTSSFQPTTMVVKSHDDDSISKFKELISAWLSSGWIYVYLGLSSVIIYFTAALLYPIVSPNFVKYPWPSPDKAVSRNQQVKEKKQTVVFAGSFNPPHNGHMAMLLYLAERCEFLALSKAE